MQEQHQGDDNHLKTKSPVGLIVLLDNFEINAVATIQSAALGSPVQASSWQLAG
jgi:hypothetical protein